MKKTFKALAGTLMFLLVMSSGSVSAQSECNTFGVPYASSEFPWGTGFRRLIAVTFTMAETMDVTCTGPPFGGTLTTNGAICTQFLTSPGTLNNCSAGVTKCHALVGIISITMIGGVPTMAGPHSCAWNCGPCGSFTINEADGLPVELMEFSVEDGDPKTKPVNSDKSGSGLP